MPQTKEAREPLIKVTSDQKISDAVRHLQVTTTWLHDVRKSFSKLQKEDFSLLPDTRMLKVHTFSRTNGKKPTIYCPEIVLRGNWLEKAGFSSDDQWVYVIALDEMILITPELKKRKR